MPDVRSLSVPCPHGPVPAPHARTTRRLGGLGLDTHCLSGRHRIGSVHIDVHAIGSTDDFNDFNDDNLRSTYVITGTNPADSRSPRDHRA